MDSPDPAWDLNVGLITNLLKKVNPSPENVVSITCGLPHYVTRLLGEKLICVDGPVFNMEKVGHLLETFL